MTTPDFSWMLRVYYEDTDAGGIVFYANYLKYFERARTEWLRAREINQKTLSEFHKILFVVKNVEIDYHSPAQLDDELKLVVIVKRFGRASLEFLQEAWRITAGEPVLLATGQVKIACINSTTMRPCSIPDDILSKIKSNP